MIFRQTVPDTRGSSRLQLFAICLGFFIVMLDTTVVNIALPDIDENLQVGISSLQWIIAGYSLMFGALLLTAGTVSDVLGARRVFEAGLIAFAVTSTACALAPTSDFLIAFRFTQGIAAALLVPTSLSLISLIYSDRAQRARAIGIWGGMGGVAAAAGPVIGGLLVTAAHWRLVFLANVPICIWALSLANRFVANPVEDQAAHFDLIGQTLAIVALALCSYGLIQGPASHWSLGSTLSLFLGLMLFGIFVLLERNKNDPLFPVSLFAVSDFSTGVTTGFLLNFAFYGQLFVLSFYFQEVQNNSALIAGLLIAPQTLSAIFGSVYGGRISAKTNSTLPIMIGLLIGALGLGALWFVDKHTSYLVILGPIVAVGIGITFTMSVATHIAIETAPPHRYGAASGAINSARQIGGVFGVAVLGSAIDSRSLIDGFRLAVLGAAIALLLGLIVNLIIFIRPGKNTPEPVTFKESS